MAKVHKGDSSDNYHCRHCQKEHTACLPRHVVEGGLAGPNLTALVACLKGVCLASFTRIERFFRDPLKLTIARGALAKLIRKAGSALAGPAAHRSPELGRSVFEYLRQAITAYLRNQPIPSLLLAGP